MASRNYQDLIAWQKAMDLAAAVYTATKDFPKDEIYGLRSQLRRAAVSVPANIAEGEGRGGAGDFVRFLQIAHGSLRELETHVLLAVRLGFINDSSGANLLDACGEVGRIINGLIRSKRKNG